MSQDTALNDTTVLTADEARNAIIAFGFGNDLAESVIRTLVFLASDRCPTSRDESVEDKMARVHAARFTQFNLVKWAEDLALAQFEEAYDI